MRLLPNSPRRRRRLAWTAWSIVLVVAVAAAIVIMPRGEPVPQSPLRTTADETVPTRPLLRLTAARRSEIDAVVHRFALQAAARRNPAAAWNDASAALRATVSRESWNAGELPGIVPFDASALQEISWRVVYREPERVGLDVLLVARPGTRQRSQVYAADLIVEQGRFLVDSWAPQATLGGGSAGPTAGQTTTSAAAERDVPSARGALDTRWLLVPAGVLALVVLVPLGLLVRNVVRNRRAYRRYQRARR